MSTRYEGRYEVGPELTTVGYVLNVYDAWQKLHLLPVRLGKLSKKRAQQYLQQAHGDLNGETQYV